MIELSNGVKIGDGSLQIMAGPCSVESEEQVTEIAKRVKLSGASILRGGAFKPRTHHMLSRVLKPKALTFESCKKGNRLAYSYRDYESFPH